MTGKCREVRYIRRQMIKVGQEGMTGKCREVRCIRRQMIKVSKAGGGDGEVSD